MSAPAPTRLRPDPTTVHLAPVLELGATQSSHRWTELPGNFDRLNTRKLWHSTNEWGIPDLPAADLTPARLVAYSDRRACTTAGTGACVHFFLDDYRFETLWSKPERGLSRCATVGAALTPDFSLWRDMPRVMQIWQVYRSRWCGAWLLHHGIPVVPTLSWSTPDTYDFAFAGIPAGSVVAVSTVGVHGDPAARALFDQGCATMIQRLQPAVVLAHGRPLGPCGPLDAVDVRWYPSRWDGR